MYKINLYGFVKIRFSVFKNKITTLSSRWLHFRLKFLDSQSLYSHLVTVGIYTEIACDMLKNEVIVC